MHKEILLTEAYEDIVKAFEKTMIENNIPLYWFDMYLPKIFAERALCKAMEISKQIKKESEEK